MCAPGIVPLPDRSSKGRGSAENNRKVKNRSWRCTQPFCHCLWLGTVIEIYLMDTSHWATGYGDVSPYHPVAQRFWKECCHCGSMFFLRIKTIEIFRLFLLFLFFFSGHSYYLKTSVVMRLQFLCASKVYNSQPRETWRGEFCSGLSFLVLPPVAGWARPRGRMLDSGPDVFCSWLRVVLPHPVLADGCLLWKCGF